MESYQKNHATGNPSNQKPPTLKNVRRINIFNQSENANAENAGWVNITG